MKMTEPVNFRDVGGLTGLGGKTVLPNRILRGGQLYGMSVREKAAFCMKHQIHTIIDL